MFKRKHKCSLTLMPAMDFFYLRSYWSSPIWHFTWKVFRSSWNFFRFYMSILSFWLRGPRVNLGRVRQKPQYLLYNSKRKSKRKICGMAGRACYACLGRFHPLAAMFVNVEHWIENILRFVMKNHVEHKR